jgi:hypothetical protein
MSCWSSFCHLFFRLPGQFWYSAVSPGAGFLDTFIFLRFFGWGIAFYSQKGRVDALATTFGLFSFLSIYVRVVSEKAGNCILAGSSCPI